MTPSPDTGAGTPLIRCVCGEIEQNRAHHDTRLSGWHPFAGEASRPATDPAGLDVERLARAYARLDGRDVATFEDAEDARFMSDQYARLSVADGPGPEGRPLTADNATPRERLAYGRGLNRKAIDGSHVPGSEAEL